LLENSRETFRNFSIAFPRYCPLLIREIVMLEVLLATAQHERFNIS